MQKKLKVVVIGGGSSYTPELIEGLIDHHRSFPVGELCLVDVEKGKERLAIIRDLAKRMIDAAGINLDVISTLNREEALTDANYVITQFSVGGIEARTKDETIPRNYHMLGHETIGIGGIFNAMRTIPVMMDVINDVKTICPEAWVINVTNPVGIMSEFVFRQMDFKRFIGVCGTPLRLRRHFADMLDVKAKHVIPYVGGLNHLSYVFGVYYRHRERLKGIINDFKKKNRSIVDVDGFEWECGFIEQLGLYPNPSLKYYYHTRDLYDQQMNRQNDKTRAEKSGILENELFSAYADPSFDKSPHALKERKGMYSNKAVCDVMDSLHNDKKDYQVVNTVNEGFITDLPNGTAIEITSRITKQGPIPVYIGRLPAGIRGIMQHMKSFEHILVDGICERDLCKARFATQIHPLTTSIDNASRAFETLLQAHKQYLSYYGEDKVCDSLT